MSEKKVIAVSHGKSKNGSEVFKLETKKECYASFGVKDDTHRFVNLFINDEPNDSIDEVIEIINDLQNFLSQEDGIDILEVEDLHQFCLKTLEEILEEY